MFRLFSIAGWFSDPPSICDALPVSVLTVPVLPNGPISSFT